MTSFPKLDSDLLKTRLQPPKSKPRVLIDTDAANEIDDQYALAWALLSPELMDVVCVTAEPFSFAHHIPELEAAERAILSGEGHREHLVGGFQGWIHRLHGQGRKVSDLDLVGPEQGMDLSYREILTVYEKCAVPDQGKVFRGAPRYMKSQEDIVRSPAVEAIVAHAKASEEPLYIAAMGCVTNIASALLVAPEIVEEIVVIWTASYPTHAPHCIRPSLNLIQDVPASQILFDSGVPLIYLPGYHVGAQLKLSLPEMETFVKGRGAIGDYLHHLYTHNPLHKMFALEDTRRRTWVIWDLIDIAWLINPEWVPTFLTPSPEITSDLYWRKSNDRHLIAEAHDVQRDEIFIHFYNTLERFARGKVS